MLHHVVSRHVLDALFVSQALARLVEQQACDARDLSLVQGPEGTALVDAVPEFGRQRLACLLRRGGLGRGRRPCLAPKPTGRPLLGKRLCTEIAREDQDGVAEVHASALAVREAPFLEHLEEKEQRLTARLVNLVQHHDRRRAPPHGLGQEPSPSP